MTRRVLLLAVAFQLSGCGRVVAATLGARLVAPAEVGALGGVEIVDLQDPLEFAAGHLPGAVRVPVLGLDGYLARTPARSWRTLLLVCTDGSLSVLAAPAARLHRSDVRVLAGGRDAWRAAGLRVETGPAAAVPEDGLPFRPLSGVEQRVAWAAGSVVMPAAMLLAAALVHLLRRAPARALRLVRHGLLWFLAGEGAAAAGAVVRRPGLLHPLELLDGVGTVALTGLVSWGLWRLLDERVLHLDDPGQGCAAQGLCGRCWTRGPVRCGVQDLFVPVAIGLAVVALMPLTAPLRPVMFRADVLGSPVDLGVPVLNHLVELRLYPVLAALLALAALAVVLRARPGALRRAEPLLFGALGLATYPLLRHLLANAYLEAPPWAALWEELTELLLVAALAFLLARFRGPLGLGRSRETAPPGPAATGG